MSSHSGEEAGGKKLDLRDTRKLLSGLEEGKKTQSLLKDKKNAVSSVGRGIYADKDTKSLRPREGFGTGRGSSNSKYLPSDTFLTGIDEEDSGEGPQLIHSLTQKPQETVNSGGADEEGGIPIASADKQENDLVKATSQSSVPKLAPISVTARDRAEILNSPSSESSDSVVSSSDAGDMLQSPSSGLEARNRWRRVKHTIAFAHQMSQNARSNSGDFLEHAGAQEQHHSNDDGRAGAAAFEGAKIGGRFRAKGRRGMEGMLVRQDKGIVTLVQDFYVACLKMPVAHFLVSVFLAPIALGLFFTPIYLLDRGGLTFEGVTLAEVGVIVGRVAAAKKRFSALVNVFLYALSLSTTFGGSPVAALSPFCLCVANVNTLMGQFLFVFLSGAVFARMSQPSKPIRCSRKAIIKLDDFTSTALGDGSEEKSKVFAVRLVLTGAAPCELVDAKICLTFRIFIKLPSGSMFCSTQDLDLVRPEVSYLKYGIMVRHVIDQKSPVYGHTMESLLDGDASFSLTVMGLERTSMQPIFHLEDYFVCDGDVAWDADYVEFIHVNKEGHRVLDHSKIDFIKMTPDTKIARGSSVEGKGVQVATAVGDCQGTLKGWRPRGDYTSKALHTKSTSFTRA